MLRKFKREKKKQRGRNGEKYERERGTARDGAKGGKGRKGQLAHTAILSFTSENVKKPKAVRLQQPTAYKPMSEESCQTVFHTEYSDLLSHRPAVQCTVLQTVLL